MAADWTDAVVAAAYETDGEFVRHAPDLHNYHYPSPEQVRASGGSPAGRYATIPAGRGDGSSHGFDHSSAGPMLVHLFPNDAGIVFDPKIVTKEQLQRVVATSTYAYEAFQKLARAAPVSRPREDLAPVPENPHVPLSTYLVPATNPDGTPYRQAQTRQEGPMTPMPSPINLPPLPGQQAAHVNGPQVGAQPHGQPFQLQAAQPVMAAPPPWQQPPPHYPTYPPPPPVYQPPDPQLVDLLGKLAFAVNDLGRRQEAMEKRATTAPALPAPSALVSIPVGPAEQAYEPPPPVEPRDVERPIRSQKAPLGAGQEQPAQPAIEVKHFLNLPWLKAAPTKPACQVVFEIPGFGHQSARYHEVVDEKTVVVLVYDTRYEDGFMYLPMEMGADKPIRLKVPHLKVDATVCTLGLNFPLGPLDVIVLVKVGQEAVDSAYMAAQSAMTEERLG